MTSVTSMNIKTLKKDCTTFHLMNNTSTSKIKEQFIVHLTGSPKSASIGDFSRFMKDKAVTDVICFCKKEYDQSAFHDQCINYHNLEFPDGSTPEPELLDRFNHIIDQIIDHSIIKPDQILKNNKNLNIMHRDTVINIHCQSGMGRAATMLAYLMITRCSFDNFNSIDHIRKYRKGAFNKNQIDWIIKIKLKHCSKFSLCVLM